MSTLFLHIGTSKTGSTSLQSFLNINKKNLLENNYYFYSNDTSSNFASLAYIFSDHESMSWINEIYKLDTEQKKNIYKNTAKEKLLSTVNKYPNHNFIISSEHLFTMWDNEEGIKNLYSFLKKSFDNIKIIVYLRDQLEYAISSTSTVINSSYLSENKIDLSNFLTSLSSPKNFKDLYYNKSLEKFIKYFGISNVHIEYYKKSNNSNNLSNPFMTYIGINDTSNFKIPPKINTSASIAIMKYKVYLNSLLQIHEISGALQYTQLGDGLSIKQFINKQLLYIDKKKSRPLIPSLSIRRSWHNEFAKSNKDILNKFSIKGSLSLHRSLLKKIFFSKNFFFNFRYKKQFLLELNAYEKSQLQNLFKLILALQSFHIKNTESKNRIDRLSGLIKPSAIGHVKILSTKGYYDDSWVQKNFSLIYENYKPISEIIFKIYNPKSLKGSITITHENKEDTFKITDKNHKLRINCYKIDYAESVIKIKSNLDSDNKLDKRELSFVLTGIVFN